MIKKCPDNKTDSGTGHIRDLLIMVFTSPKEKINRTEDRTKRGRKRIPQEGKGKGATKFLEDSRLAPWPE